jgi:epoxyqueuosine reductase
MPTRTCADRVPVEVPRLVEVGRSAGLAAVGVTRAERFARTRHDLEVRRSAGLHAGMQFTYRRPERSADPGGALPDACSLVVGAAAYPSAGSDPDPAARPAGRVARYAADDRYGVLTAALRAIAAELASAGWRTRVLADDNALVDREAARRAGIGFYGKSTNLLLPGLGSWFVLGAVLTDAPLEPAPSRVADSCGSCVRCLDGCPTAAIVAPGVVDARRCLAWLLQQPGSFPREFRRALGDRIYGCDDCQEVCPPNRGAATRVEVPPGPGAGPGRWVPLLDILGWSDAEVLARVGRWYLPGRDPAVVRRNALVALGNTADPGDARVVAALDRALADDDPVLRGHAVWAARRLGLTDLVARRSADERDPDVLAELAATVGPRSPADGTEAT